MFKRSSMLPAAVALLSCLVMACGVEEERVAAGQRFPFERIGVIKRGNSTEKDVMELLGPPHSKHAVSERREQWRYYVRKEQKEKVLWFFTTSTHVTELEVIIVFDGSLVESVNRKSESFDQ